jgi:hypothetical protein
MKMRTSVFLMFSGLYWTTALVLTLLAIGAPCGFAPGAWCEEEGPNLLGAVLGALGPAWVLLISTALYATALWIVGQRKKR